MDPENLVLMANRIGQFFAAYPDQAQAKLEIGNHLRRYWEPRMRRALYAYLETSGGTGLEPLVLQAVQEQRVELEPKVSA